MKITLEVDDELLAQFTKRSLEKEKTVQDQIRGAFEMYFKVLAIPDDRAIVAILRSDLPAAKRYNTLTEIPL